MAGMNSGEEKEIINKDESPKNMYAKLIKEYSKDKLANKDERSQYVQDLRTAGNITPGILADIEKYAGRHEEYDGLPITTEEIKFAPLNRETAGFFATLSNNKRSIKDIYLQEYDIDETQLSMKIDTELDRLTEQQVADLLKNEKNRKLLLERSFGSKPLPHEKSIANFLKDMNLESKYKLVKSENETQFYDVVQKVNTGRTLEDLDIEILIDSGAYNQREKQSLIEKLLPSISLAQAKRYGLIETVHAKDLKEAHIREIQSDLERGDVREISGQINDEDILIATSKFTDIKKNRDKIIDNPSIFNSFLDKYNSKIRSYREQLEGKEVLRSADFLSILKQHPKVSGAENMKAGAIMQISQKQKNTSGEMVDVILYGKIKTLGEDGSFKFEEKGQDKYDVAGTTMAQETYTSFISHLSQGNAQKSIALSSLIILSPAELESQIQSHKIKEYQGDTLRLTSKDQINSDIASMTDDINGLEEALRDREVQIRNDLADQGYDDYYVTEKSEQIIAGDPAIQDLKSKIQDKKEKQYLKTQSLDSLDSDHYETLKKQIDEIDVDGAKYKLEKGTTFKTKAGDIYTITHDISQAGGDIHMTSLAGSETYSFEEFYRGFKSQDTKRVNLVTGDFGVMVDTIKNNSGDDSAWKGFSFTNGKIKKENSKEKITYDYLAGKGNEELLKIHDISGDLITISFGTIKGKAKKDKEGEYIKGNDKQRIVDETFTLEQKEYVVTTGFLQEYISEHSLEPRGLKDNQEATADKDAGPMKKKIHLWSVLFHERATISDAIKGGTLFIEQMKEMIEKGSDEKSNQFALKYMGAFLTEDARRDMQSRLEQKQKKSMEDYLERLKGVASDVAVKMIDQWLHDKHAPDYMHEAAVVFMLEKYGVLNAKALEKHEGKYVWYQALGGEINDTFFKEIEKEKGDQGLPFTEELLVYLFLKRQCRAEGYNGKKRRSKLHKEVKKHRAVGKDEEYETGKRDGNDERTLEGRVNGAIGEMHSNNYPNMVGWLEVAVNKGGPMHIMNKVPFLAAFSGVAYNFEEKTTDQLKNFPGGSRLLMMLRFFSYHHDLDTLNKTILAVCNTLETKGKHPGIASRAQALFDQQRSSGKGVKDKLLKTEAFYDDYGEDITKIMYMLNTGDKNDNLNKLIFFEKDNEENPDRAILKEYYTKLHTFVDADTSFDDEEQMSDPFRGAGTSGLEMHKFAEQQIGTSHGKFKKTHSGAMSWDEIQKEFEAIPHRQYDIDPAKNKKKQMNLLSDNLQRMISGIILSVGTNGRELAGYNEAIGPFNKLNKWGIDMTRFEETTDFSVHGLLHAKGDVRRLVEEFANQIIETELHGTDFSHKIVNVTVSDKGDNGNVTSIANSISNATKTKVSQATTRDNDDDYEYYQQAA